jgi:hypothetical protein
MRANQKGAGIGSILVPGPFRLLSPAWRPPTTPLAASNE